MDKLKGLKIVHVYHDAEYGRETMPILDAQAAQYGFTVWHLAVPYPGLDQKATWLRVKVAQPDWVILRSQGVMTATALKEAAQIGFPRDKMVGPHATCAEQEVVTAGEAAIGFICANCGAWEPTSRSSRISSPPSMPRARGRGRHGMLARRLGSGVYYAACSPRRRCARRCATSATNP
jgi:hypothetical protein